MNYIDPLKHLEKDQKNNHHYQDISIQIVKIFLENFLDIFQVFFYCIRFLFFYSNKRKIQNYLNFKSRFTNVLKKIE